jgi:hypothetical protein
MALNTIQELCKLSSILMALLLRDVLVLSARFEMDSIDEVCLNS